jgi:hypothetical protein
MTDQRLDQELGRRAAQVTLQADWARTQLLPAVDRALSMAPERMPASRLAPVAELAGLAAILVLIVVALPLLVPGLSSTPSPSGAPSGPASASIVLTTQQFAEELAAGDLDGMTVVVRGRIEPDPDSTPMPCIRLVPQPAPSQCAQLAWTGGILAGVDPPIQLKFDPTETMREVQPGEPIESSPWTMWDGPRGPIEGLLVLSVDRQAQVTYVGRVHLRGQRPAELDSGLLWSAEAAANVDPESLDIDEVLLVDGWLMQVAPRPCPQPLATPIGSLPYYSCGRATWLTDTAPESLDEDPPDGLRVQDGAMYLARGDRSWNGPLQGRFVVGRRLFGGGCTAAPPCWGWSLLAVMSIDDRHQPPLPDPTPRIGLPTPPDRALVMGEFEVQPARTPEPPQ